MAEHFEDFVLPSLFIFSAFIQIFLFCEFGERIIASTDQIPKDMLASGWYAFPMEIQKVLPVIICSSQRAVGLHGFGNIICTRQAFKDVRLLHLKRNILMDQTFNATFSVLGLLARIFIFRNA